MFNIPLSYLDSPVHNLLTRFFTYFEDTRTNVFCSGCPVFLGYLVNLTFVLVKFRLNP